MATTNQYQAPLANSDPATKLGWLRSAVTESMGAMEQVPGFDQIARNTDLIRPDGNSTMPNAFSRANIRSGKSAISDVVSMLCNLKFLMNYTNQNARYSQQADILNKCAWAWYTNTYASQPIQLAVQYSAVQYLGWLITEWNPNFHAPGIGDVQLTAGGPTDVLLLFPDSTYDEQKAYGVIIVREMPLVEACATWPDFRDAIKPTSENASWWSRNFSAVRSRVYSFFQSSEQDSFPRSFPTVTVYDMYLRDMTRNTTGQPVTMGLPGSNWCYTVPSLGADMPDGTVRQQWNPETLTTDTVDNLRKANDVDALLYPFRRQITFTDTCVMYDNTSRHMHGLAPVVKFQLDPWPFDYFGGCMADDIRSVEGARNQLVRGAVDSCNLKLDPPKEVNAQQFSQTEIEAMTLRKPGYTVQNENFQLGPAVRPIVTGADPYGVDSAAVLEWTKYLDLQRDDLCARVDFNALARARSSGMSGDSMETLLALAGPRTTSKATTIEIAVQKLGKQLKGYFMQWYDAQRRFTLFGYQGLAKADWDYDPNSLIPDEIQGLDGTVYSSQSSLYNTRAKRGRMFQFLFTEQIEPGSLHDITNMTRQLSLLTLQKVGFPVDWWTIAESFSFTKFGPKPEGVEDNMLALYAWQTEMTMKYQAMIQAEAQKILQGADPQAQAAGALGQLANAASNDGNNPVGRPNTFEAPPQQETRTDNGVPRVLVSTSN